MSTAARTASRAPTLDAMLAQTGDGAFVIDDRGCLLSWNRAAEKLLGYAAHEVIGRPCREVLDGCDPDGNRMCRVGCTPQLLLGAGEIVYPFEMRTATKAGVAIWLSMSVLRIPPVTLYLFRDVSLQRRLLELLHDRLVVGASSSGPAPAMSPPLSARETEVLKHLAAGTPTAAIARQLFVSPKTVRNHVQAILGKLGVHSRLEAITLATRHGWV